MPLLGMTVGLVLASAAGAGAGSAPVGARFGNADALLPARGQYAEAGRAANHADAAQPEKPPQAEQPAQASQPARAKPPMAVAGVWTGIVIRGADRFRSQWSMHQIGNRVTGTVTDTRIGGSGYGRYRIAGKVTGDVLWYRGEQWLTSRPPGWCLPAGTLKLGKEDGETFLSGRWRANSASGGCAGDVSASVKLSRGKGD